jgi:hypothetical protein
MSQLYKIPLPEPPFSPGLIFHFDHVKAAIAMVEDAIMAAQRKQRADTSSQRRAMQAASDPNHSFLEAAVMAPSVDAIWDSALTFPQILRRSLFIAVASHTEHVLHVWCEWLRKKWLLGPLGKSRKGTADIVHFMAYLRDVANLPLAGFEQWSEWPAIDAARLARNALAHNGGIEVDPIKTAKIEILPCVSIDTSGLIMDEPTVCPWAGACEAAADNAKAFFDRIGEIVKKDPRAVHS